MKNEMIENILRKEENCGLSITDLVEKTNLSRSALRIELAKMEGANLVSIRKVGMAKLYFLKK